MCENAGEENSMEKKREIRELDTSHIDAYTEIAFKAYPSFKDFSPEAMNAYKEVAIETMVHDPVVTFYGMFEGEKLIAVMRHFDFEMNCFGKKIPVAGLGFLGVHLMHKKEKAAREMVAFYEAHYRERKMPISLLLPFRPDFYKKMGYGHGTKMNQYRLETRRIPRYDGPSDLRYLRKEDLEALLASHGRVADKTHGMITKFGDEIRDYFSDPFHQIVASYDAGGKIEGYMVYQFRNGKPGNYTINQMYLKELIYERVDVLAKLLGFLRKQEDQVQLVIFNTQDEHFHYLFDNPLDDSLHYIPYGYLQTNVQAIGVMYKILDVREAFRQCAHRNYNSVTLGVRFLIENEHDEVEELIVSFEDGLALLDRGTVDVTVECHLSDFSPMFLGSTSVRGLHSIGLLRVDDASHLDRLHRAFDTPHKPVCYTDF